MSLDLMSATPTSGALPADPAGYWTDMSRAIEGLSGPVLAVNVDAFRHNALDMAVRAGGVPLRVASKSVRVRHLIDAALGVPGYRGILAFTLPEALWLVHTGHRDVVVGYPTADRAALAELVADAEAAASITLMVDDPAQLDLVDAVVAPQARPELRVCMDVDASWEAPGLGHVGVRRSPLHTAAQAAAFARLLERREGFHLTGVMMYEAQIAGQPDHEGPADSVIRWMQRRSAAELLPRRAAVAAAVSAVSPLEFVNGGGTGSVELTASDQAVTEVTAGSGLLAGHLFDHYRAFTPAPAEAFALEVVRKPAADIATVLGGGWIASGPPLASRQPLPVWPAGLRMLGREGAGEVQTPLQGDAARALRPGDRVWFRHAKSGEPAERAARVHLVSAGRIVDDVPTYRGEGKAFL